MTPTFKALAIVATLGMAAPASAKPLSFTIDIRQFWGHNVYLAAYVVDPNGAYVSTLAVAGTRERYLADLSRWARMISRSGHGVDGSIGASLGAGTTLAQTVDVPDQLFNAGYTLRVETAVENQNYIPNDAAVALTDANNGKPVAGTGYINNLTIRF